MSRVGWPVVIGILGDYRQVVRMVAEAARSVKWGAD